MNSLSAAQTMRPLVTTQEESAEPATEKKKSYRYGGRRGLQRKICEGEKFNGVVELPHSKARYVDTPRGWRRVR